MKHINCPSRFFLMCGNLQLSENMSQRIQLHLVDVKCTAIHETKHNLPGKLSFSSKDVSLSGIPRSNLSLISLYFASVETAFLINLILFTP